MPRTSADQSPRNDTDATVDSSDDRILSELDAFELRQFRRVRRSDWLSIAESFCDIAPLIGNEPFHRESSGTRVEERSLNR